MHFMVAALGKDCDTFTLHIYASLAEQEREMISERIKAALARSKNKFGLRHRMKRSKAFRRRLQILAVTQHAGARLRWSARKLTACTLSGRSVTLGNTVSRSRFSRLLKN